MMLFKLSDSPMLSVMTVNLLVKDRYVSKLFVNDCNVAKLSAGMTGTSLKG